jgi:hypothetical protein
MNPRRISTAVVLTVLLSWTPGRVRGQSVEPHSHGGFSAVEVLREHRYQVDARIRPFLFWIRKSNIGDGRLTWRRGSDGSLGYELLVGSDPLRTPRHINRWGYLREESSASRAIAFGVMSQSDEQSVEDAEKNTNRSEGIHPFKALRQSLIGAQARVTASDVRVPNDVTYTDLDVLLSAVPGAPSTTKTVSMAQWTSPGFLAATATLMEQARSVDSATNTQHLVRTYPYNAQLYDLQMRSADRIDHYTRDGRSFGAAIRARFTVLNRTTKEETPFTVTYGRDGDLAGVPLLISWRPRWWFEIECALRDA